MTLDQIYMRLADKETLRKRQGSRCVRPSEIAPGPRLVRTADGTLKRGTAGGKSKAQLIREKNAAKHKAASQEARRLRKQEREERRKRMKR